MEGAGSDIMGHGSFVSEINSKGEDNIDPTHMEGAGSDTVGHGTLVVSEIDSRGEDIIDPTHVEGAGSDTVGRDTLVFSQIDSTGANAINPTHVEGTMTDTVGYDTIVVSGIICKGEDTIDPTHVEGAGSDKVGHDSLVVSEIDSKGEDIIAPTHVEDAGEDTVGHDALVEIGRKGSGSTDGVGGDQMSLCYTRINGDMEVLDVTKQGPETNNSDCGHVEDKDMSDGAQFIEKVELFQNSAERVNDVVVCDYIAEKIERTGNDAITHAAHDDDTVDSMGVESVGFVVGATGSQGSVPSEEIDAEPDDVAVACHKVETKDLKNEPSSEGGEIKIKQNSDRPQFLEEAVHTHRSDNINDNMVCDFVAEHLDDRDNEIGGERKELLIEKGLCEPDFVEGDLGAKEPGEISDGNRQQVVTCKNPENIVLGTMEGLEVDLTVGYTSFGHHSLMDTEEAEDPTQALSIEEDHMLHEEDNNVAHETLQSVDTIGIAEEYDPGLEQMKRVCEKMEGELVADSDAKEAEMVAEFNAGSELLVEKHMETVSTAFEHSLVEGEPGTNELELISGSNLLETKVVTYEKQDSRSGTSQGLALPVENQTMLSHGTEHECQDIQPPDVYTKEHELVKSLEAEQGISASGYSENTRFQSQKSWKDEAFDVSDMQIEKQNNSTVNSASTSQRATYSFSIEKTKGFSISDLVWGKVKSHPWWPGQIIDFSDASELAFKYQKKGHFLVAYFGDKTFAWCKESNLKPFQLYFSQMEKQSSSDSFLRGMSDILAEVFRRIELGMTCLCIPEDTYADIKYQKIENAGIRGKIICSAVDGCQVLNCFQPKKLLAYITALAQIPTGGADRLELAVGLAQLKAFYRSKGSTELPAFTVGSGLVENDIEVPSSVVKKTLEKDDLDESTTLSELFSTKGKSRGRDGSFSKEKLIADNGRKQQVDKDHTSSGKKRKDFKFDFSDIGRSKTKKLDSLADRETKLFTPTSNISFKVGEFISRAASKLTSGQLSPQKQK